MGEHPVEEYLRKKGALEVLLQITGSATFQDIDEAVLVSSSTVSNRLKEAVEHDLVEITHRPLDHGTQKRYELTDIGKRVTARSREIELDKTIRKLQRLQQQRETELEQLIGQLTRDKLILGHYDRFPGGDLPSHSPEQVSSEKAAPIPDEVVAERRRTQLEDDLIEVSGKPDDDESEE